MLDSNVFFLFTLGLPVLLVLADICKVLFVRFCYTENMLMDVLLVIFNYEVILDVALKHM